MSRQLTAGTPGRRGRAVARSGTAGGERVRTPARKTVVGGHAGGSGTIAAQQTPRQVSLMLVLYYDIFYRYWYDNPAFFRITVSTCTKRDVL